jgi:PEGA domain
MSRRLPFLGTALALTVALTAGCVDRRFVIESDPPGAIVYVNDRFIGPTPADLSFLYYGKYRFVYVRDGFETLTVDEQIRTPWWSYFPLEFFVENLLPCTIRDVRHIRHPLQLRPDIPPEAIHDRAEQLRAQASTLGPHAGAPCPPISPAPIVVPPAGQELPPTAAPTTPVPIVPSGPVPQ